MFKNLGTLKFNFAEAKFSSRAEPGVGREEVQGKQKGTLKNE